MRKKKQNFTKSVFYALLWKEWRRQRVVVLFVVLLPLFSLFSGFMWHEYAAWLSMILAMAAAPIIIMVNAFAGEVDDGSWIFATQLPCSGFEKTLSRLGMALIMWLAAFLLWFWPAWSFRSAVSFYPEGTLLATIAMNGVEGWLILGAVAALSLTAASLFAAKFHQASMVTMAMALAFGAALLGALWLSFYTAVVLLIDPTFFLLSALFSAGILLTFSLTLLPAQGCLLRKILACGVAYLTFVILILLPSVAAYFYELYGTEPNDYFQSEHPRRRTAEVQVNPCSENPYFAIACTPGWANRGDMRVAIANIETGEWFWLDTIHSSFSPYHNRQFWSPDGRMLLISQTQLVIWPLNRFNPAGFHLSTSTLRRYPPWLFDLQDRSYQPLENVVGMELVPYNQYAGWLNDTTLWAHHRKGMQFLNVREKEKKLCTRPKNPETLGKRSHTQATDAGVIECWIEESDDDLSKDTLRIIRFHPALATGEVTEMHYSWNDAKAVGVSLNSEWVVVWDELQNNRKEYYICNRESGEITGLESPDDIALPDHYYSRVKFLPDSRGVVFLQSVGLVIYDLLDHTWRSISIEELLTLKRTSYVRYLVISPDGNFAAFHQNEAGVNKLWVVDLEQEKGWQVWENPEWIEQLKWYGNRALVVEHQQGLWLISRDGSENRLLIGSGKTAGDGGR